MTETIKVAILGAAGESAGLILKGLLESTNPKYEVAALVRLSSVSKPSYEKLASQGVNLLPVDLESPDAEIAKSLRGYDVVIASVPPNALESQLPLARAAKLANVKRFVPSSFAMAIAPSGISSVQTVREKIHAEIAAMGLLYTIIDVGWWYSCFIPQMPSGQTDHATALPDFIKNLIPGDGNMKTNVVDNDDVGRFVARILADSRTINKKVMASGAAISFNEMFGIAETLTGEKVERKQVSADGLKAMIRDFTAQAESDPRNYNTLVGKFWLEYYYSSFIDGDNSPEGVKRLGYLLVTDLYPDLQPTTFEQFFAETLANKRRVPYSDRLA
ncbi:hypothetical protein LCI18_014850 [Fusarium solani-melongenae]|uniref:Uncharacterized protein n=1 Tax=Fusarium solani subsp. cucurbitae TaxID=2747967 RepID=A0ACD3ZS60_FUSSC|nr:hypothetical protein LCI18_014850 [Fusarium solani-melongenae]